MTLCLIFPLLVRTALGVADWGGGGGGGGGGGTTAAANAGRWSSESAKDGYVRDSLPSRLSVSKALSF